MRMIASRISAPKRVPIASMSQNRLIYLQMAQTQRTITVARVPKNHTIMSKLKLDLSSTIVARCQIHKLLHIDHKSPRQFSSAIL
jgi:hypothetical protein